ncbi:MAG: hypothetical protein IT343_07235 [Candidatus Melainabacteria bacterium]|jgi:DNA-binding response OmpR family regulator|nr:hypothetical protein [Candidatus Melainabacteria bacterium]
MQAIRVLLIEDCLELGDLLQEVLQAEVTSVNWFVRARISEGKVILMDASGKESPLDCSLYDVALLDGRLKGSSLDGWDLVPHLVASKLPVIATSGDSSINRRMVELGALRSLEKFDIFSAVRKGVLFTGDAKPVK